LLRLTAQSSIWATGPEDQPTAVHIANPRSPLYGVQASVEGRWGGVVRMGLRDDCYFDEPEAYFSLTKAGMPRAT
jgi:hypothetical protein